MWSSLSRLNWGFKHSATYMFSFSYWMINRDKAGVQHLFLDSFLEKKRKAACSKILLWQHNIKTIYFLYANKFKSFFCSIKYNVKWTVNTNKSPYCSVDSLLHVIKNVDAHMFRCCKVNIQPTGPQNRSKNLKLSAWTLWTTHRHVKRAC